MSIRHIQQQLVHVYIEITLIYTRLTNLAEQNVNTLTNQMIEQLPRKLRCPGLIMSFVTTLKRCRTGFYH